MSRFTISSAVFAAALAAGCAGTVGYSANVNGGIEGPDLVYAAPGVQVIADYDEPIFFADSYYWRYDGAQWSRSASYTGGWVTAAPTSAVLRIESPRAYVHYKPQGWVDHRAQRRSEPSRPARDARPQAHAAAPARQAAPVRGEPAHDARAVRDERPEVKERDHR